MEKKIRYLSKSISNTFFKNKKTISPTPTILILAAGSSSRLGQPKQLVRFQDKTLITHAIDTAVAISDDVITILGCHHELIAPHIADTASTLCHFQDWAQGMGSTISYGVQQALNRNRDAKELLILLCDQPYVTASMLSNMLYLHRQSDHLITASGYDHTYGVPAIFDRKIFLDLLGLKGAQGAKKVIHKNFKHTQVIAYPEARYDIDTPRDLSLLKE